MAFVSDSLSKGDVTSVTVRFGEGDMGSVSVKEVGPLRPVKEAWPLFISLSEGDVCLYLS